MWSDECTFSYASADTFHACIALSVKQYSQKQVCFLVKILLILKRCLLTALEQLTVFKTLDKFIVFVVVHEMVSYIIHILHSLLKSTALNYYEGKISLFYLMRRVC